MACGYCDRSSLTIVVEHYGQRTVLRLRGELDVANRCQLQQVISDALQGHPQTLVIDLSALGFADCAGLAVLVWANRRQAENGHKLIVAGARPLVSRLLSLTGLEKSLHLTRSTGEASDLEHSALGLPGLHAIAASLRRVSLSFTRRLS